MQPPPAGRSPSAGESARAAGGDQPGTAAAPHRTDEARQVLQEIRDGSTEGFETPDLLEADALIRELA